MQSESVRQKAIRYINELNDQTAIFQPYHNERGQLGHLIHKPQKSKSQNSTNLNQFISQKSMHVKKLSIHEKPQKCEKTVANNSSLDLSSICNLEAPTAEELLRAQQYKEQMEKKAFIQLLKNKKDHHQNPYLISMIDTIQKTLINDQFQWKMSNVDKGKNLTYLFQESKIKKNKRKIIKIDQIPQVYDPNYQSILPKPSYALIKPANKQTLLSHQNSYEQIKQPIQHYKSHENIARKQNTLERMYNNIQTQITKDVQKSMSSNPQALHPLESFSVQPFDESYISDFKKVLKTRIKETALSKKKMQDKIKEMNDYIKPSDS